MSAAAAQERVVVATVRSIDNGPLLLAFAQGAFKAEGLNVELKFYATPQQAVTALAAGEADLASAEFTAVAFNLAGKGSVKIIAGQAREKRDFEGNVIVASSAARSIKKADDLAGHSVAVIGLGSVTHYMFSQIAAARKFDFKSLVLKPQPNADAAAKALAMGQADAAILPPRQASEIIGGSQGTLVGWVSEFDEPQIGGLFVSAKALQRRPVIEAFVRGYRRGAADFAGALVRKDKYAKRVTDAKSRAAATLLAPLLYPTHTPDLVAPAIETSGYYVDPQERVDVADVTRQFNFHKSQGLIESTSDVRGIIDNSFTQ
ncbi:MAG: ABC transporter substrate-binding protein [Pseudolabrys sp.]|nr:ABC transporter substrate-binding protein [Pseudolabrys sp.]